MELLIAIGIPLLLGGFVWLFFQRDLDYFRQAEKLKIGELEALVQRHRKAVMLHFAALVILLPTLIFKLGGMAVVAAILFAAVFLGHVSALSRLSRPIIESLKQSNARLQKQETAEEQAFLEEIQAARKRLGK